MPGSAGAGAVSGSNPTSATGSVGGANVQPNPFGGLGGFGGMNPFMMQ
jgi:hypothetical protein